MARKKKKKPTKAASKKPAALFNNPFGDLKLSTNSPSEKKPKSVQPKPQKIPESSPLPQSELAPPPGIDPMEAALFLSTIGSTSRMEQTKPKIPGPSPTEVAKLEDDLAFAELQSLIGKVSKWEFDIHEDGRYMARAPGVARQMARKLANGEIPPNKSIDLHGQTRQEAHPLIRKTLVAMRRSGNRCLHVVTGRGNGSVHGQGILKEALPHWLTTEPLNVHTLAVVTAPGHLGGLGAYLILLRRSDKP